MSGSLVYIKLGTYLGYHIEKPHTTCYARSKVVLVGTRFTPGRLVDKEGTMSPSRRVPQILLLIEITVLNRLIIFRVINSLRCSPPF